MNQLISSKRICNIKAFCCIHDGMVSAQAYPKLQLSSISTSTSIKNLAAMLYRSVIAIWMVVIREVGSRQLLVQDTKSYEKNEVYL